MDSHKIHSDDLFPRDPDISQEMINRYVDGKMTAEERHWFEKQLLSSGLHADAVEGLQYMKERYPGKLPAVLTGLEGRIDRKAAATRGKVRRLKTYQAVGIAASIALLLTVGIVYLTDPAGQQEHITLREEAAIAEETEEAPSLPKDRDGEASAPEDEEKSVEELSDAASETAAIDEEASPKPAVPLYEVEHEAVAESAMKANKSVASGAYPEGFTGDIVGDSAVGAAAPKQAAPGDLTKGMLAYAGSYYAKNTYQSATESTDDAADKKKKRKKKESDDGECKNCAPKPQALLNNARVHLENRQPEKALTEINQLLNEKGHEAYRETADWYRATAYVMKADKSKAREALNAIIQEGGFYKEEARRVLEKL